MRTFANARGVAGASFFRRWIFHTVQMWCSRLEIIYSRTSRKRKPSWLAQLYGSATGKKVLLQTHLSPCKRGGTSRYYDAFGITDCAIAADTVLAQV
jgi:hypothetical protein